MESNWGRWGVADERGALNLITPETSRKAVECVRSGEVLSLARTIYSGAPVFPGRAPTVHFMAVDGGDWATTSKASSPSRVEFADDYLGTYTHHGTHLDALSHVWVAGELYNGFSRDAVRSSGAKVCDVEKVRGIVTRGVLIDLPSYFGVEHLAAGQIVTPTDLDGYCTANEIELRPGDAVLLRTGWQKVHMSDPESFYASQPGIGIAAARRLAEQDVSMIAADNLAVERMPWGEPGNESESVMPCHAILLRDYGIHLAELLDLDELASRRRSDFLFIVAPLRIKGGVGSPVNPLAVL